MLKVLKNKRAQASAAEYLLVLGIVVTAIVTMTVYFRRAVQGRIRDAELTMVATAINRTGPHYQGNWYLYYEPYYFNTTATISRDDTLRAQLNTTTFAKTLNTYTSVQSVGNTASPRAYLNNIPTVGYTRGDLRSLP